MEENIWWSFLEVVERQSSKGKTAKFLDTFLSANEKKLISKRLAALVLIKSGKSYKEVGKILWMSPGTISALKKSVYGENVYQSNRHYSQKSKDEKMKRFKGLPEKTIFDYWLNFPFPSGRGKGRWKYLNYQW